LVALHAVTLLFERASHRELEVFRIFEESISILVEKMTVSFKYFRAKGFRATADAEGMREDYTSMKKRHKLEGRQFQEQIQDNVSALLELRDIADELGTLKKLFEVQQESVGDMLSYYERCGHGKTNGCLFLHEAQVKLKDYLHQIHQMMDSANSTKNDVSIIRSQYVYFV
jgi:C1A family cysteine protease